MVFPIFSVSHYGNLSYDSIVVVFTIPGCSYWAEEKPNAVMPVRILKNQSTFLANPVTLKLTPLTVGAAQSRSIIGDFPDDTISPNRARKIHFLLLS